MSRQPAVESAPNDLSSRKRSTRRSWPCDIGCMAMGKKGDTQDGLFVAYHQMRSAGHPFYRALDAILRERGFDSYVEKLCSRFYHPVTGRPGLAPGNYFRSLLVGYFAHSGRRGDPDRPPRPLGAGQARRSRKTPNPSLLALLGALRPLITSPI